METERLWPGLDRVEEEDGVGRRRSVGELDEEQEESGEDEDGRASDMLWKELERDWKEKDRRSYH